MPHRTVAELRTAAPAHTAHRRHRTAAAALTAVRRRARLTAQAVAPRTVVAPRVAPHHHTEVAPPHTGAPRAVAAAARTAAAHQVEHQADTRRLSKFRTHTRRRKHRHHHLHLPAKINGQEREEHLEDKLFQLYKTNYTYKHTTSQSTKLN